VVAFGKLIELFLQILAAQEKGRRKILAHFHEWMSGSSIADIRRSIPEVATVFTTHATFLGRCLAVNDPRFYDHLPFYKWQDEAKKLNIEPQNLIERIASNSAHVFTTVSDLTALECKYLLGREVDVTLPNGINLERFVASHESQVLHQNFKEQIHQFTMSHFFPSYSFDLDKTLYFFTSGRYEYRNKGFDLTLESLARLNWRLKQTKSPLNIVVFFITKRPFRHIIPEELGSRAMMDEILKSVKAIQEQVGERLFLNAAMGEIPDLNELVDEYWNLRLRRNLQAWKSSRLPTIVTHSLHDEANDEILAKIRTCKLINEPGDPVKVVYHPDFVTANNPLFGMDYDQFVRGCHLGIFPSYYEPWGYTPLECIARGIPAVTSDLSGFGSYLLRHMPDSRDKGIYIAKRHVFSYEESANQLTDYLFDFVKMERRERIALRNEVEKTADSFDWMKLGSYYDEAYVLAEKRI
ncbi:MAG: glycosyltransferase, partial [Spirochaetia bacterium]|nr:glycosyltransferase [Spirochaetia bacterium]